MERFRFNFGVLGLTLMLVYSLGCTRAVVEKSKFTLDLPSSVVRESALGKQSYFLMHVVVNASGPNMQKLVSIFDAKDGCQSSNCSPKAFAPPYNVFEITTGNDRLIQVLAVYANDDGTNMKFYYGDATQTLSKSEEVVKISVTDVGEGSDKTGQIIGRYRNISGTGPTGDLRMTFSPPGNRPIMEIETTEIFAGWFSTFGLNQGGFNYVLEDGTDLFGGRLAIGDLTALPPSNQILRISVPGHYRNSGSGYESQEEKTLLFGQFGPGRGTDAVTYPSSGSYSKLYLTNTVGTSTLPYFANSAVAGTGVRVQGGCPTGTCATSDLSYSPDMHNRTSSERSGGFRGPFRLLTSGDYANEVVDSGTGQVRTLTWSYVPGLTNSDIDGVRLFARGDTTENYQSNHDLDCTQLTQKNFFPIKDVLFPNVTTTLNLTSIGLSTQNALIAVCPFKGSRIFRTGGLQKYNFPTSPGANASTFINIWKSNGPENVGLIDQCAEYSISANSNGNMVSLPTGMSFDLKVDNSFFTYYSTQATCSSGTSGSPSNGIALGTSVSQFKFWRKLKSNPGNETLTVSNVQGFTGGNVQLGSNTVYVASLGSTGYLQYQGPQSVVPETCYPFTLNLNRIDQAGPWTSGSDQTITFTVPSGVTIDNSPGCSGSTRPTTLYAGNSTIWGYFKVANNFTNGGFDLKVEVSSIPAPSVRWINKSNSPATISRFNIQGPNIGQYHRCEPFTLQSANADGAPVAPSGSNLTLALSPTGGSFYIDTNCTSPISTATISSGLFQTTVYFRPNALNSVGFSLVGMGGYSSVSNNFTFPGVKGPTNSQISVSSGPHAIGSCIPATLNVRDDMANPFFVQEKTYFPLLGLSPNLAIFADTDCTYALPTGVPVEFNFTTASFYILTGNPTTTEVANSINSQFLSYNGPSSSISVAARTAATPISGGLNLPLGLVSSFPADLFVAPGTGKLPLSITAVTLGSNTSTAYTPNTSGGGSVTTNDSTTPSSIATTTSVTNVSPALSCDLNTTSNVTACFTFARPSTGTYVNASGDIVTAGSGIPRIDHHPTSHEVLGLLIEGARTNLVSQSEDLSESSYWTFSGQGTTSLESTVRSPAGTMGVAKLAESLTGASARNWNNFAADLTNDSNFVASAFLKKGDSRYAALFFQETTTASAWAFIDFDTGAVSKLENANEVGVIPFGNGWFRVWLRYRSNASATASASVAIFPATAAQNTQDSLTGYTYAWGVQVETGDFPSSYIPTTTTPITRGADDIIKTNFGGGSSVSYFAQWYNPFPFSSAATQNRYLFHHQGSATNSLFISPNQKATLHLSSGDVGKEIPTTPGWNRTMVSLDGANYLYNNNGVGMRSANAQAHTLPDAFATLRLGHLTDSLFGHIRHFVVYSEKFAPEVQKVVTTQP